MTIGSRVPPGTPEELDARLPRNGRRARWRTFDLAPGSLFHVPARTPHAVICRRRSLAVTLTWSRSGASPDRATRRGPPGTGRLWWDVVSGFAEPIPPASVRTLWTQVPVVARAGRGPDLEVWTPHGKGPRLPAAAGAWMARLALMPSLSRRAALAAGLEPLIEAGILGPRDLPLRIRPDEPAALDGWRFG